MGQKNGGHWSQVLSYNSYFNVFLKLAICPNFVGHFSALWNFDIFFIVWILKLDHLKASFLIWAKSLCGNMSQLTLLLDLSIWLCWTTKWPDLLTFYGFGIVLIQILLSKVIFTSNLKLKWKLEKSPFFPLKKAKIEKWPLLRPIWADLAALWNLRLWDPYASFEPTLIKFWDICSGNIIGMAPRGPVKSCSMRSFIFWLRCRVSFR